MWSYYKNSIFLLISEIKWKQKSSKNFSKKNKCNGDVSDDARFNDKIKINHPVTALHVGTLNDSQIFQPLVAIWC